MTAFLGSLLRPFNVGTIRDTDLQSLVDSQRAEDRTIEFKAQLPGNSESERKEFLADVTSFANAQGGVILYGVGESANAANRSPGVATTIPGLPGLAADKEIQRLEAMLRSGVDPPLSTQLRFQTVVRSSAEPPVLAIGVFRSFAGPHQVTYQGSRRFWVRGHTGKYEPDVTELKNLFLSAASWLKQVDEFRRYRLERLRSLPRLDMSSVTLFHVLPLAPVEGLIDLRAHESTLRSFPPLHHHGWSHRFNADGYMTYDQVHDSRLTISFTQWFRTGGVEGYSSQFIGERSTGTGTTGRVLWLEQLQSALLEWTPKAVSLLVESLQLDPPLALLLSLQRVQGARIPATHYRLSSDTIDWDDLLLPPVLYEPLRDDLAATLQSLFDTIAQSAGLPGVPTN